MEIHVFYVVLISVAFSAVSVVVAIVLDRRHYQDKKIEEWSKKNEKLIAELQLKAVTIQNRFNTMLGQLLALGIKLPQGTHPESPPATVAQAATAVATQQAVQE